MTFSDSHNTDFDDTGSGNDALEQAAWDFFARAGWNFDDWDDESEIDARAEAGRRAFKALLAVASPQERLVLKTALSHLKAGKEVNWEAVARDLGKTSGAVKTQVRRAVAKLNRGKG